jgi:hypothetical protein
VCLESVTGHVLAIVTKPEHSPDMVKANWLERAVPACGTSVLHHLSSWSVWSVRCIEIFVLVLGVDRSVLLASATLCLS